MEAWETKSPGKHIWPLEEKGQGFQEDRTVSEGGPANRRRAERQVHGKKNMSGGVE